jgi:hypothetical protein
MGGGSFEKEVASKAGKEQPKRRKGGACVSTPQGVEPEDASAKGRGWGGRGCLG